MKVMDDRLIASLFTETVGILILFFQWFYPMWFGYHSPKCLMMLFVPFIHLCSHVIFQRLLLYSKNEQTQCRCLFLVLLSLMVS